jgi:hypothetical protein
MPNMTKTQQRAENARRDMSPIEEEMLALLESVLYSANAAGDPHHWERSTFGATRNAIVACLQAVLDRTNPNIPAAEARKIAVRTTEAMIANHENARYNLRLIAEGVR